MTKTNRRGGKRVDTAYQKKRKTYRTYSHQQREAPAATSAPAKKTDKKEKQEHSRLWQLIVSAVILLVVIAVKFAAPQALETYKEQMLRLLGEDTDFVAAFSAVGRAVGLEDGIGKALSDAYTAVFGSDEVAAHPSETGGVGAPAAATVYTEENLPENVCIVQTVLNFPYGDPLEATLTDRFGYRSHPIDGNSQFHYGLDLEAASGTVIHSFADGTVSAVGESSALGKYITVVHAGDYTTLYAHCSRITASAGQQVKLGAPIAEVGDTGQVTGPHLHFELYRDTTYYNPIYYVSV